MAVRTAYVGTQSAGDVLTSANFSKLPGGCIGYASVTTAQAGIGAAMTDLTSLSVAVTVNTSRLIRIQAFGIFQQQTSSGNQSVAIREGSTGLAQANGTVGAGAYFSPHVMAILSPTGGAHTYKVSASTDTATLNTIAGATFPLFIAVFDDGPAF